jgi:hypothetical protein
VNRKRSSTLVKIIFSLTIVFFPLAALAQDDANIVPFVDGTMWGESSREEKVSYIVGLSNLLDAAYAYQQGSKNVPTGEQSFIGTLWTNIDDLTLDQCIDRIDSWYANNPDGLDEPVLDVIWLDMVEPNLD